MKYTKQPKRHIVLDDFEWRALVKGINEYRKSALSVFKRKQTHHRQCDADERKPEILFARG